MERSSKVNESIAGQSEEISAFSTKRLGDSGEPHSARGAALHPEAKAPRPRGRITTANVLRLLEFQQHRCALTGRLLSPETASLDHILPVRLGGEHAIEDTQVLHKEINRAKATMTNTEFVRLCREVVAYLQSHYLPGSEARKSA